MGSGPGQAGFVRPDPPGYLKRLRCLRGGGYRLVMRMSKEERHQGWLHATPQWVDARMDEELEYQGWSPMGVGAPATAEHVDYFQGVLPASVLHLWERCGFDGFGDGRWWFTDPYQWAPVVEAWLEGTPVPFPEQRWWCLARSAMGKMRLWGRSPALR